MLQISNGRSSFYQWDLNQRLIVNDTVHNQVHFSNSDDPIALVMEVYEEDGVRYVNVPNILLQTPSRITAYLCNSDNSESHTHVVSKFAVKKRPKPADYIYTETEVYDFNSKLDNNLGSENAGKALVIDKEGDVVPGDVQSSGGGGMSDLEVMELMTALQ